MSNTTKVILELRCGCIELLEKPKNLVIFVRDYDIQEVDSDTKYNLDGEPYSEYIYEKE